MTLKNAGVTEEAVMQSQAYLFQHENSEAGLTGAWAVRI